MIKEKTQGFSLKGFTAAVIGVGGLGCNIATHLAGAGIGKLLLFDFDKVSETNLNRQFLYTKDDIGKAKAAAAKEKLSQYAPEIEISAFPIKIRKNSIPDILSSCDIIFLAVDNKSTRQALSDFAHESFVPLVLGGIDGFFGKAYLYIPTLSPCPECAGMLDSGKTEYNISATAGIIGSFQTALGIKYLLTKDKSIAGILNVYDSDSFSSLKIIPSKKCNKCKYIMKEETV